MKLEDFENQYKLLGIDNLYCNTYSNMGRKVLETNPKIKALLERHEGATFENGLIRIHNAGSFYFWPGLPFEFFKRYRGKAYVFAYDWMGRQYAVLGENIILMLDPATAEVFELKVSLEEFFNVDLSQGKEDLLEQSKFLESLTYYLVS